MPFSVVVVVAIISSCSVSAFQEPWPAPEAEAVDDRCDPGEGVRPPRPSSGRRGRAPASAGREVRELERRDAMV